SAGIFLGDSTLRTLRNQIRSEITNSVDDIGGPFAMLIDIGITTDVNGSLIIDSSKLGDALNTNFDDVGNLFSSTNGIASRLDGVLTEYTKSEGIIDSKTKGLNTTIDGIEKDFEALDIKLKALEERLLKQFSGLDVLLSQLNSTSNFLTQQFDILGNLFKKK
ncbi:MAG: flagellar hook-associated protein 2, partial [Gammaproteobacteria bacterium]